MQLREREGDTDGDRDRQTGRDTDREIERWRGRETERSYSEQWCKRGIHNNIQNLLETQFGYTWADSSQSPAGLVLGWNQAPATATGRSLLSREAAAQRSGPFCGFRCCSPLGSQPQRHLCHVTPETRGRRHVATGRTTTEKARASVSWWPWPGCPCHSGGGAGPRGSRPFLPDPRGSMV